MGKKEKLLNFVLNTRIGRFIALVVIVQITIIPLSIWLPSAYLGAVVGNLVMSLFIALTMKVY